MSQSSLFDDAPGAANPVLDVFFDGGARGNPGPAAIGAVVFDPATDPPRVVATVSQVIGETTNNVAEYRALIAGVEAAARLGARRVRVHGDSMLVVQQLRGKWKVKSEHLKPLLAEAKRALASFDAVEIEHVRREENIDADALVNAALDAAMDAQ